MFNNRNVSVFLQWIFVLAIAATAAATTASAQTYQNSFANTYTGSTNPTTCGSKQMPCKHIKDAINNTAAGGTLTLTFADTLDTDTANACHLPYENIVIKKSITIQADSGLTTKPCFIPATSGIDIEAKVDVYLKGLRFVGSTGSSIAVSVNKGAQLFVDDCYFYRINYAVTVEIGSVNISCSTLNDLAKAIILHDPHGQAESATITGSHFIKISTAAIVVQKSASVEVSMSDFNIHKALYDLPTGTSVNANFNSVTHY